MGLALRFRRAAYVLFIAAIAACGPSGHPGNGDGGIGGMCTDGQKTCDANSHYICVGGAWQLDQQCPALCDDNVGCVTCVPGTGTCNGNTSHACKADGSGYEDLYCDPVQGVTCNFENGVCEGDCAPQLLGDSYIGCEYFPTVTGNLVNSNFQFAVTVSNAGSATAMVTIEDGGLTSPMMFTVPPGQVAVQYLPWVATLKMCDGVGAFECGGVMNQGSMVPKGAYHLRSTEPVTVYQFSPLDYTDSANFSYTNDASLLLPSNVMTGNYLVAAFPYWDTSVLGSTEGIFPSLLVVTATQDATSVTISTTAATQASSGAPAFSPGVPGMVTLNQGDVLELAAFAGDMTGSVVQADKPVQVIAGQYCTQVPQANPACDHLEENMFPTETLSTKYVVTNPAVPALPDGKEQVIRIVATEPTSLTYDPPVAGAPTSIATAGGFIEISRHLGDFVVTSDHKIIVAQYMESQDNGGSTGDPAMALAVATDQYRTDYLFEAPTNYEVNYVNITAPMGTVVMVDGMPVTVSTAIGGSGFGIVRQQLGTGANGTHTATSDTPFGISVYGYGQYTSYWYPGGLNLTDIPVQ